MQRRWSRRRLGAARRAAYQGRGGKRAASLGDGKRPLNENQRGVSLAQPVSPVNEMLPVSCSCGSSGSAEQSSG